MGYLVWEDKNTLVQELKYIKNLPKCNDLPAGKQKMACPVCNLEASLNENNVLPGV